MMLLEVFLQLNEINVLSAPWNEDQRERLAKYFLTLLNRADFDQFSFE